MGVISFSLKKRDPFTTIITILYSQMTNTRYLLRKQPILVNEFISWVKDLKGIL